MAGISALPFSSSTLSWAPSMFSCSGEISSSAAVCLQPGGAGREHQEEENRTSRAGGGGGGHGHAIICRLLRR